MKIIGVVLLPLFPVIAALRWSIEVMYGFDSRAALADAWNDWRIAFGWAA